MPSRKLDFILQHRNGTSAASCRLPSIGFVGIGKTGSLFMQSALELFAHEQMLPSRHRNESSARPCAVGARMGWHHASAPLWQRAFGPTWADAFTFTVVRDPWARLVSHWAFHINSKNPLDGGYLTQERRRSAALDENQSIAHFRSWVRHARRAHPPDAPDAWKFTSADGHGNELQRGFNASQTSWLVDESGTLLVDDVFRLEDLSRRWPELQAKVCGLPAYAAVRDDPAVRALDHPSRHAPYAAYYDEETSRIVGEYMAPDIRRFGYVAPWPHRGRAGAR